MTAPFSPNIERLHALLRCCTMCPRHCRVDRTAGRLGSCRVGAQALVASVMPHFGEEAVLVGRGGSGTIFLAGCNLHCVFCQNHDISQSVTGRACSPGEIADLTRHLREMGCVNVNFVTPTHVSHAVAAAIVLARQRGPVAPTVYNCGGYESVETLRLLDGLIDIYLPDFKYADPDAARRFSQAPDYPAVAAAALAEMYRQVGPLTLNPSGVARRGLLVRHLVLPADLAKSRQVLDIIAQTAPGAALNVMAQYRPAHRADQFPELLDRPLPSVIAQLRAYASHLGLQLTD